MPAGILLQKICTILKIAFMFYFNNDCVNLMLQVGDKFITVRDSA